MSLGTLQFFGRVLYADSSVALSKQVFDIPNLFITRTTRLLAEGIPLVGTTALGDVIPMGSVVNPGFAVFQNLDKDNFVEIGSVVGGVFVPDYRLDANDGAGIPFWLGNLSSGKVWKYRADTSPAYVAYTIFERNP